MTAAVNGGSQLDSMTASVGAGLDGDKAAQMLSRLASREAQRRAQAEQQSADQRYMVMQYCLFIDWPVVNIHAVTTER